jgi:transcriptional regulator with XRE-family HTH domain
VTAELGERIRSARVALKMTQADVARITGISLRTIQAYEQGRVTPSTGRLLALQKTLKVRSWLA